MRAGCPPLLPAGPLMKINSCCCFLLSTSLSSLLLVASFHLESLHSCPSACVGSRAPQCRGCVWTPLASFYSLLVSLCASLLLLPPARQILCFCFCLRCCLHLFFDVNLCQRCAAPLPVPSSCIVIFTMPPKIRTRTKFFFCTFMDSVPMPVDTTSSDAHTRSSRC